MPSELTFAAAVLLGLLGSSHCIGMCGGIVGALNMGIADGPAASPVARFRYQLAYNAGRISSYVLVGLLAGSLGSGAAALGVSPLAGKLLAAAFMIALGLYLANWWRGLAMLERIGAKLWRHIQPLGQRLFPIRSTPQALLLGMLWGWLPCGLVYAAVAWSLTTGNPVDGALLMLGFGIGTLPALLVAGNVLGQLKRWAGAPAVRTTAGIVIIIFGLYSAFAGLTRQGAHHHTGARPTRAATLGADSTRVPAILRSVSRFRISTSRLLT